jgi:hypothetical protein
VRNKSTLMAISSCVCEVISTCFSLPLHEKRLRGKSRRAETTFWTGCYKVASNPKAILLFWTGAASLGPDSWPSRSSKQSSAFRRRIWLSAARGATWRGPLRSRGQPRRERTAQRQRSALAWEPGGRLPSGGRRTLAEEGLTLRRWDRQHEGEAVCRYGELTNPPLFMFPLYLFHIRFSSIFEIRRWIK